MNLFPYKATKLKILNSRNPKCLESTLFRVQDYRIMCAQGKKTGACQVIMFFVM